MIDDADYSNSTIRLLVFQALKHWGSKPLFSLLFDEDYIVRSAAARELQTRGEQETFHNLKDQLTDSRGYVREIFAFILGQLGTPERPFKQESIPLLMNMLDDDDDEVRAASVCALGHLFSHDMPEDVEVRLSSMVDDSAEDVRGCLAFALGNSSGSRNTVDVLNQLVQDDNKEVRSWAETGLKLLKNKEGD